MRPGDFIVVLGDAAVSMACLVAGALCLRSWRRSGDQLFVFFAVGFWLVGLSWTALAMTIAFHWIGR